MTEMAESIEYDLLIVGSGLAGLRAAISAAKKKFQTKNCSNSQKSLSIMNDAGNIPFV